MKKLILVTGATGYIGYRLVNKLVNSGHKVKAMLIENDPLAHKLDDVKCEKIIGDITKPETLKEAVKDVKTAIHLAAVLVANDKNLFHKINYEGTKNLIDACVESGVEHFVLISAAAAVYKTKTTYGKSKILTEKLASKKREKTNFTIIRPTLLYGHGGSQELKIYVEKMRKFPLIIPTIGLLRAKKRPVWVSDIVEGLSKLVNNKLSYGKVYHFGGSTILTMWEYTKLIKKTFNIKKPMVPIPLFICYIVAYISEKFSKDPILKKDFIIGANMDADWDYGSAFDDLGYRPVDLYVGYPRAFAKKEDMI